MAEYSGFFPSINGDRKYFPSFFAEYFADFISNGIYPNPSTQCQVLANNDMAVTLKPGNAYINGYKYINDSDKSLSIETADGVLKRIDRIVLRHTTLNREIKAYVKKGTFASSPVAPALQRDADVWELGIADIYIGAGATSITQVNVTDLRLNNTYCGIVHGLLDQVDGETLFIQFQAIFDDFMESLEGVLDENAAGNLLNLINDLVSKIGSITSLTTTEKSNLVAAINELVTGITNIESDLAVHTTAISNNDQEINNHTGSATIHVTSGDKTSWNGKIDKSLITAPGDLIYGSAANTPAKLAKGTDGQFLKLTSGLPSWGSNGNDINYELLGTITTTAGQASIEFTNIPTSYDYLMIKCTEILSNDSSGDGLRVIFNNDPAGNILGMGVWSRNGNLSSWTSDGNFAYLRIYGIVSPSPSMQKGSFDLEVKQLDSAKFKELTLSNGLYKEYPAQPLGSFFCGRGWWMNQVSKVTNVKFAPENTTRFAAGCTFKLYGGKLNG